MPGFKPLKFAHTDPDMEKGLCGCKKNKDESGPFCDGSHKLIDW
jgi:CDGSH-type Zn-finger protein